MTHASRHVGALAEHAASRARLGAFPLLALSPLSGIVGQLHTLAILRSAQGRESGERERQGEGEGGGGGSHTRRLASQVSPQTRK